MFGFLLPRRFFLESNKFNLAPQLAHMLQEKMKRSSAGECLLSAFVHRGYDCAKEGLLETSSEVREVLRTHQPAIVQKHLNKLDELF